MTPELGTVAWRLRDEQRPLVVLGPSLGTSVTALWQDVVPMLTGDVDIDPDTDADLNLDTDADADADPGVDLDLDVVGWDLPGHGTSPAVEPGSLDHLTVADLAAAVLDIVDRAQESRGDPGAPFWYAGVSVGGAVGLQLLIDAPERVRGAALICTAASFGEPGPWADRGDLVVRVGTPTQVSGSAGRWFAPGFLERSPGVGTRLLGSLQVADRFGYAAVCGALARFDVRSRLGEIGGREGDEARVLAVAGADDPATPPARLEEIAAAIPGARLQVIDDAAHLAPAEQPARVAEAVRALVSGEGYR